MDNETKKQLDHLDRMIEASRRSLERHDHEIAMKELDIKDLHDMKLNTEDTIETLQEAKNEIQSGNGVPDHVMEGIFGADFDDE